MNYSKSVLKYLDAVVSLSFVQLYEPMLLYAVLDHEHFGTAFDVHDLTPCDAYDDEDDVVFALVDLYQKYVTPCFQLALSYQSGRIYSDQHHSCRHLSIDGCLSSGDDN